MCPPNVIEIHFQPLLIRSLKVVTAEALTSNAQPESAIPLTDLETMLYE